MTTTLNVKIMKRGKFDTTFTQIHKSSLSGLGIGIKITTGGGRYSYMDRNLPSEQSDAVMHVLSKWE
jgi:hypothetical protein